MRGGPKADRTARLRRRGLRRAARGAAGGDGRRRGAHRHRQAHDVRRTASGPPPTACCIHDLLARHPEILEIPITRPVIVVGLPRSGTTHLVNLLAADTRFRSMPLWESYEPVPNPDEPSEVDGVDPRWTRCQGIWEAMQAAAPLVAAMHPMEPDHVHEEIELQMPDFSSYTLEWVARAPRWRDHYLAHDQTPHYAYMKSVLQILQWFSPKERWVLKSPQHLEQLGPLLADVSRRHRRRDPSRPRGRRPVHHHHGLLRRPHRLPHDTTRVVPRLLDRAHRHVARHLVARPAPAGGRSHRGRLLRRVHGGRAGHARTGVRLRRHAHSPSRRGPRSRSYRAAHPRGREGRVAYDLRRNFAVTPEEVRGRFGAYLDRFPVRVEVS